MFGAAEAAQYMSPYQRNVTDIGIRDLNEQAARSMALAGINSARGGGYGSSGNAITNAMTARTLNRDVGDLSTKGAQAAYDNAQQQYQRDRAAREYAQTLGQNSASGLASLGTTRQTADLARIGAQNAAGSAARDLQQRRDDLQKEEFINQRDYAKNQLNFESGILQRSSSRRGTRSRRIPQANCSGQRRQRQGCITTPKGRARHEQFNHRAVPES
jgi:hypothetical protein